MKVKNFLVPAVLVLAVLAVGGLFAQKFVAEKPHGPSSPKSYFCPMHPDFTSDKPGSCSICGMDLVKKETAAPVQKVYLCPMHPQVTSDKPGSCSICGMDLVKKETSSPAKGSAPAGESPQILYYRNPMDPQVTSPVPMKDSMGMDYVPVYALPAGQQEPAPGAGVYISPERQQRIGVKKGKVEKKHLFRQISTVGKIAYDPDLYVAQEEYIQALKVSLAARDSVVDAISEQAQALAAASQKKLRLLGMSPAQIEQLEKDGQAQENLFLPSDGDKVWVYMTVYENDQDSVKEGAEVEVSAAAFPGEVFRGVVRGITPVVNPQTRSVQARAEMDNPGGKFKPGMFLNVRINVEVGEKLAVAESAVLDTGMRKIVYLAKDDDHVEAREVRLGAKAEGYYEVLSGLQEGDMVITSGNFLVDSESKLNSVLDNAGQ